MTERARKIVDRGSHDSEIVYSCSPCQVLMIISPEVVAINEILDFIIVVVGLLLCYLI